MTIACILNEIDTLRKNGRTPIWGSHGFEGLTLKHLLECGTDNRHPIWKNETKFKG
jgi:hypothetical protein